MSNKDIAIKVDGVGKRYRIGQKESAQDSLGGQLIDMLMAPMRNYRKYRSLYNFNDIDDDGKIKAEAASSDILWALQDVSFEVARGEVLGIIGPNGAGKSTLLKILSRITPPTTGHVEIHGKVSSLLEVGTGFHPELTGRENIYLNGTILGMKKKEVDDKFEEIVEFSGVSKFLDTPVKRYSSGMTVRLAFAVAAHLEPDILIIDEVLAVGDAAFQRKCLNKMQDVGKSGRTVLFVSHSMPAVTRMCERVIMIDNGRVHLDGAAHEVVGTYLKGDRSNTSQREWPDQGSAPGGEVVRLRAVRIKTDEGTVSDVIDIRRPVAIEIEYDVLKPGNTVLATFALWNEEGVNVCVAVDMDPEWRRRPRPPGRYTTTGWVPGNYLSEGMMNANVTIWTQEPRRNMELHETDVVVFQVYDNLEGDSARGDYVGDLPGTTRPLLKWSTQVDLASNEKT
jgi:lipopolysaccharide transport system ATP-binding protein